MNFHRWLWAVVWPLAILIPIYGGDLAIENGLKHVAIFVVAGAACVAGLIFGRWKP